MKSNNYFIIFPNFFCKVKYEKNSWNRKKKIRYFFSFILLKSINCRSIKKKFVKSFSRSAGGTTKNLFGFSVRCKVVNLLESKIWIIPTLLLSVDNPLLMLTIPMSPIQANSFSFYGGWTGLVKNFNNSNSQAKNEDVFLFQKLSWHISDRFFLSLSNFIQFKSVAPL